MKTTLLSLLGICTVTSVLQAQVIFYEDFNGQGGPQGGGAGTYFFPSGWLLRNVDNGTPAAQVSYINDAWERREDFGGNVVDSCAFSTSWYTVPGAANDWMWTPLIANIPANSVLSWRAKAYDPLYPDGYEVRIVTQSSTPMGPTGGTGTIGNQMTNSTVVFSTAAENSSWTNRSVNLNAFVGESVWIGFRNNSNDQFILVIDDIKVEVQANYDAQITVLDTITEYTAIPEQQNLPLDFSGTVRNNGVAGMTGVSVQAEVFNSNQQLVYSSADTIGNLGSGATATFSIPGYTSSPVADVYTIRLYTLSVETDNVPANDTVSYTVEVTDTVFARDNGQVTNSLGIGAGTGGYLGQDFEIVSADDLTSISWYVTQGYTGRRYAACVWNMTGGVPNAIIASTDTLLYPNDSARFITVPIHGGPFTLQPGRYAVTVIEFDSTLAVGLTSAYFTPGRTWVDWPGNPLSGWANNEDFGVQNFNRSYLLRMNLGYSCNLQTIVSGVNTSCEGCSDGSANVTVAGANGSVTYLWSNGDTTASTDSLAAGVYTITITDEEGCVRTDSVLIASPLGTVIPDNGDLHVFPNPSDGQIFISPGKGAVFGEGHYEIYSMSGAKVFRGVIPEGSGTLLVNLEGVTKGNYIVSVYQDGKRYNSPFILQ